MPSLKQTRLSSLNLEGYTPVVPAAPPPQTPQPTPSTNQEPSRNAVLRCTLPPLWQASPDSLRQFYLNGKVPQFRLMSPNPPTNSGNGTTSSAATSSGGSSGGGGGTPTPSGIAAAQAVFRTPSLPPGNAFTGVIPLSQSYQLLTLAANGACRIELYGNAVTQAQDLARALDTPPAAGTTQNIVSDIALDTAPFQWVYQNRVGANADSPQSSNVYVTVTNIGSATVAYVVTITYVPLET